MAGKNLPLLLVALKSHRRTIAVAYGPKASIIKLIEVCTASSQYAKFGALMTGKYSILEKDGDSMLTQPHFSSQRQYFRLNERYDGGMTVAGYVQSQFDKIYTQLNALCTFLWCRFFRNFCVLISAFLPKTSNFTLCEIVGIVGNKSVT